MEIVYENEPLYLLWLQVLLDDVKVSEQLLDLVFYILIVFGGYEQVVLNPYR